MTVLHGVTLFYSVSDVLYETFVVSSDFSLKFFLAVIRKKILTGHGGLRGCETSSIPYFVDSRLTDGGELVSLTRWPRPPAAPPAQERFFGINLC
jgi:hypothetical protein